MVFRNLSRSEWIALGTAAVVVLAFAKGCGDEARPEAAFEPEVEPATALASAALEEAPEASEDPGPEPIETLPDILEGERHVLRVDDVMVGSTFAGADPFVRRNFQLGLTESSTVAFPALGADQSFATGWLADVRDTRIEELPVATGRLFALDRDVAVVFAASDLDATGAPVAFGLEAGILWQEADASGAPVLYEAGPFTVPSGVPVNPPRAMALADFDGDGLDDVVFHSGLPEVQGSRIRIGTAASPTDPGAGLVFGPELVSSEWGYLDMAVGDLDADGQPEIVGLYHTASSLLVAVHTVDPSTLAVGNALGAPFFVAPWSEGDQARLEVGKFDDDSKDHEIVVVQAPAAGCSGGHCAVYVRPYDVDVDPAVGIWSFVPAPAADVGVAFAGATGKTWNQLLRFEAASGPLDWFGGNPREQLVLAAATRNSASSSGFNGWGVIVVEFSTVSSNTLHLDPAQATASAWTYSSGGRSCMADVVVGRFDPASPDEDAPTNQQVAFLEAQLAEDYSLEDCAGDEWGDAAYTAYSIGILNADPGDRYRLSFAFQGGPGLPSTVYAPPRLARGDFQGRSVVLGEPMIVTVATQIQPEIVVNAPPMHFDYFTPTFADERPECYAEDAAVVGSEPDSWGDSPVDAAGCIQNVSGYPGHGTGAGACDYCAKFAFEGTLTEAGQHQSTTSHTWSNEIGGSASWTYGSLSPNLLQKWGLGVEIEGSGKWMSGNTVSQRDESLDRTTISLSTTTGPDDYVLYTAQDLYFYMYPVIGKTDDEGNDVYMRFVVPSETQFVEAEASSLQWWQPPHEVGNLFSYPGNPAQLRADHPEGVDESAPFPWTSQVQKTQTVTWTQNQTDSQSVGSVSTGSWSVGGSISGAVKIRKLHSTLKGEVDYDHNESTSNSTLNTTTKSLSASSGFTISTEAFTQVPESNYRAEGHIFGMQTPTLEEGYWDDDASLPYPDSTTERGFDPDQRLDGSLELVYWVDMLPSAAFTPGDLWGDVYGRLPDIALHHPKRYRYMGKFASQSLTDWWKFVPLYESTDLGNVHSSDFLKMKGLFINPATAADDAGPQLMMADEGTQLRLAARIYNNSLVSLPPGASVKVRFYGQRLEANESNQYDVWAADGCFVIGEDSVSLGAFRSDPEATEATNRTLAQTVFDTSGRAGEYLVFWVVAWAENADGTLVRELEQHGLTAKPRTGCPADSILGMPMEFYSNNVGFYDQPFYVVPELVSSELTAGPTPAEVARLEPTFSVGPMSVSAERPYANEPWDLITPLTAGAAHAVGVHLVHRGRGPGGQVTAVEMIPFIGAGKTYQNHVRFRPRFCGVHVAYASARPAFQSAKAESLVFEIPCRPRDVTAYFNEKLAEGNLAGLIDLAPNGQVKGRLASLQTALLTAEKLADKGALQGACRQYARALARVPAAGGTEAALRLADMLRNVREQLGCR